MRQYTQITSSKYYVLLVVGFYLIIIIIPSSEQNRIEDQDDDESDNSMSKSIFDSLKGFVNELGEVMKDVRVGVDKLSNGLQSVEDILDATVDEDCYFDCPNGETVEPNPLHKATSNGCGSFGLEKYLTQESVPFINQFIHCCDEHDICYGTCLNDKDECDLKFKKCLYKRCSENIKSVYGQENTLHEKLRLKGCKAGAKVFYTGTASLGCKSYLNAQKEACLCKRTKSQQGKGHRSSKKEEL